MANTRQTFKPLEFIEATGKWSWPPEVEEGRLFRSTVEGMEDVLWTLVREGGAVEDLKGGKASFMLADKLAVWLEPKSALRLAVDNLIALGLVERIKVTPNAKRTRAIRLLIPPAEVPGKDPHPPPVEEPEVAERQESLVEELEATAERQRLARAEELPTTTISELIAGAPVPNDPMEVAWSIAEPLPVIPAIPQASVDYEKIAMALLEEVTEVIRGQSNGIPASWADRNHIADKLEKAERRVVALTKDVDVEKGVTKSLRMRLGEAEGKVKQLEANLRAALLAARDMAERAGVTLSQDAQRELQRVMSEVPGMNKKEG